MLLRLPSGASAALILAALAGCDLPQRYGAAQDVHAFLKAVQANDRAAFEAHIDRPALRAQLRESMASAAAGAGVEGPAVAALLQGKAGDALADRLIRPDSFRIAWDRTGLPSGHTPSAAEITPMLRITGPGRACLHGLKRPARCLLSFRDEAGTWKLTGVEGRTVAVAGGDGGVI